MRPGCGSMSVDPDLVDALRARFSGHLLKSRRIELADLDDEMEVLFDRGFTDGLPVVPPTEERVLRMLEGTTRAADEIVAVVPPDLVEVTVEKVAINAVMAGCKPEYLPWVIAAVEAVCTDEFNIHGVLATTMPVGPVIVCNGPGHAGDRHERRRQRARSGQPGQPHHRPRGAAGRAQRRRRAAGRGRSGRARQPGQAQLLLRRGRGVGRRSHRSPTSRGRRPRRRRAHGLRRRGPALHRRPARPRPRLAGQHVRRVPAHAAPSRSWCSASTPSSWSGPSTPGSSPTPAGIATACSPSCTRGCSSPAASWSAAPAASPRASPSHLRDATLPQVPARTASCWCTPAAAPGCSRRSSAAGPTATSAPSRSPSTVGG